MTDKTYSGNYNASSGTLKITAGDRIVLSGTASLGPTLLVTGGGTLVTSGTASISGLGVDGGSTFAVTGSVSATGALTLASATLRIESGGSYGIFGDAGIAAGSGGAPAIYNAGTLAKVSGSGVSHVGVTTVSTGTLSVADGNLRFDGIGNVFSGTYIGSGMIDYGLGSVSTLYDIDMVNGACTTNFGTVNQAGTLTLGSWSTIKNLAGNSWNFTGDNGFVSAANHGPVPTFTNRGMINKTGGSGTTVVGIDILNEDSARISAGTGTLSFNGAYNMFSGTLTGAGTIAFGGGGNTVWGTGTKADVANLAVIDAGTSVTIDTAFAYAGKFAVGAGATVSLGAADSLTLSGTTTLNGRLALAGSGTSRAALTITGAVSGSGTIALNGTASVELGGAVSGQTVSFTGTDNLLKLNAPASFGGSITGFATGSTVDLAGQAVKALAYDGTVLSATFTSGTVKRLTLSGLFAGIAATSDGNRGTNLAVVGNSYSATSAADIVAFAAGANTVSATAATLGANDSFVGGSGTDTLSISGGGSIALGAMAAFCGFERVALAAGADYALTTANTNVASGQRLTIDASALGAGNALDFNGAAETDGSFSLIGGAGNDRLVGGRGADTMAGGAGDDAYWVNNRSDIVTEAAGAGSDTIYASVGFALGAGQSIEVLATDNAASRAAIRFTGNEFSQAIYGNAGNNVLYGLGGDDWLAGGADADTMFGGTGDDGYLVDNARDKVFEAVGEGSDSVYASVSYSLRAGQSIEVLGVDDEAATTAVKLTGNDFAQTIYGNAGDNIICGLGGNDWLVGGAGADTMIGGIGDDGYSVDNAGDKVHEAAGQGYDGVYTSVSYTLGAGQSIEALGVDDAKNTAAIDLTGNDLAQAIYGNAGDNTLSGLGGDDWLVGGAGADTMIGGTGNDGYVVDSAYDKVIEAAGVGYDSVYTSVGYALAAGQSIEKLSAADTSSTSPLSLGGNALAQAIFGGSGNDGIDGGGGNDYLSGGAGNDSFIFDTRLDGSNTTIADFTVKADMICLDHTVFQGLAAGALDPSAFRVGAAATASSDRIVYDPTSGGLFYDSNGSAAGGSTQFATLSAGLALSASDFRVG